MVYYTEFTSQKLGISVHVHWKLAESNEVKLSFLSFLLIKMHPLLCVYKCLFLSARYFVQYVPSHTVGEWPKSTVNATIGDTQNFVICPTWRLSVINASMPSNC